MNEKTIGYILLFVGIILIVLSAVSVFLVFTKQMQPVPLFSGPGISIDPNQLGTNLQTSATVPAKTLPKQELISGELLNQTSNLFAHVFLMGFVAASGSKLAQIGVQLLRPIVVRVKEKDGKEYQVTDQGEV